MPKLFCCKHISFCRKAISAVVVICFSVFTVVAPAGSQTIPTASFGLTTSFQPPVLRGMTVHPENPLLFDFIVDRGQDKINNDLLKDESTKLIKYFLTSMTIPDKDAWVNLSPFEKDRIIPDALGQTEMGRQMLEQDYVLKQLAASLTNPDTELGKKYWDEVNKRSTVVGNRHACSLQNKVWIVPDGATVVEKDGFAYITESKLNVMLDEDYEKNLTPPSPLFKKEGGSSASTKLPSLDKEGVGGVLKTNVQRPTSNVSTKVFRDLILPKLIEEVNTGKNFAATRQVYQSVILAAWYKRALKDSLLGKIYADKSKIAGVETDVKDIKQKVYEQYLEAFKKGAYNVIKEENGPDGEPIPRKYFSGGELFGWVNPTVVGSSAAVDKVAKEISQAGSQVVDLEVSLAEPGTGEPQALVAASGVEDPDVRQANTASAAVRESDEPKNPARRRFIQAAGAVGVAGSLGLLSSEGIAAELALKNNMSFEGIIEKNDTFVTIVDQLLGGIGTLTLLEPDERERILKTAFQRFKQENPQISLKGINDPITPGIKFIALDTANYIGFAIKMAFSNVIAEQSLLLFGQRVPIYYVEEKVPNLTAAIASFYGQYGIFINIQMLKKEFLRYKEFLSRRPDSYTREAEVLWGRKTDPEILGILFSDILKHEIAHWMILQNPNLSVRSPEPWFQAISSSSNWPKIQQEILAYLSQMANSKDPKYVLSSLKNYLDSTSSYDLRILVPAVRAIFITLFDELNYEEFFAKSGDWGRIPKFPRQRNYLPKIMQQPFYEYFRGITWYWSREKKGSAEYAVNSSYYSDFIFSNETKRIKKAAALSFETLTQQRAPSIVLPSDFKMPKSVFQKIIVDVVASASVAEQTEVASTSAVQAPIAAAPGGIDFDPSKLNLQIKRDGHGVPLPLPQQDLENINIKGLYPVILNILPVNAQTLPILGQLNDSPPPAVVSKV